MKKYELNFLVSSLLSDKDAKKINEEIISFIQKENGLIVNSGDLFKKTLAYPVKGHKEAFLFSIIFCLEAEKVKELGEITKKNPEILRSILSHKKERIKRRFSEKKPKKILEEVASPETKEEDGSTQKDSNGINQKIENEQEERKGKLKQIEEKLDEILNK